MAVTKMLLAAILTWISICITVEAQYRPKFPSHYLQREIFVLNLEDGFFGCQVNESTDVLQLFELSKLCDGLPQCFLGSDEVAEELKCTDRNFCHPKMPRCINGVCLDNLCYCNDGFGGKGCEMPDENECKYRPCDVFSRCTNTMGSFYCSCFPGYQGDGFECHDINECEIPSLAAICVENSECCNLPGHYVCKCQPGFTGNATVQCIDIDECLDPSSCGRGALCENIPGSYRCYCPPGYDGDPFRECIDLDECRKNPCGPGAICTNTRGGYQCKCNRGFTGNPTPEAGCVDIDECVSPNFPCAREGLCTNTPGSYFCRCPEGYTGNGAISCSDINECPHACGANTECTNNPGSYTCRCKPGYIGDPYLSAGCHNENECSKQGACGVNAVCQDTPGSYSCQCQEGYTGDPFSICRDIDECLQNPCSDNSVCRNLQGSFECRCLDGYEGNGREKACTRFKVDVPCQGDYDCTGNAQCIYSRCQCKAGFQVNGIECVDIDECRTPQICGKSAICQNSIGGYRCECKPGFEKAKPTPESPCRDVNECLFGRFPCGTNAKCINKEGSYECVCPDNLLGDPSVSCESPCNKVDCGSHATCQVNGREAACVCDLGFSFDPSNIAAGCLDINECEAGHGPSGLCGQGAICTNVPGSYHCYCPPGFTGDPFRYCEDINECDRRFGPTGQCGEGAICTNVIGSFTCSCPPGFTGNGRVRCQDVNECAQTFGPNGKCGVSAICTNTPGSFECRCPSGTSGDPFSICTSLVQCTSDSSCPGNAKCTGRKQCYCPKPNYGDDCRDPCDDVFCGDHAVCKSSDDQIICVCNRGYTGRSNSLPGCVDIDECSGRERVCGSEALCRNIPGSYECVCPHGHTGDPYSACIRHESQKLICSETKPCPNGEECVSIDRSPQCVCKRGYTRDPSSSRCRDINECTESRGKSPCGKDAFCLNHEGSYVCRCPPGFVGNAYSICYPELISCSSDNQCPGNTICLSDGLQGAHCGCKSPFVQEGEYCILVSRNCSKTTPCPENQECVFTGPGYGFCICPRGYTVTAQGFCRDIDECVEIKEWSLCGLNAECVNIPGSYQCLCAPGYTGSPRQGCSRIEIRCRGANECPKNFKCTKGQCQCLPPYVLEGQECKHPCDWYQCGQYATCVLDKGRPRCECIPGCTGNANNGCRDINECTADLPVDPNGPCAVGAICINLIGGYQCECPPDTQGDPYKSGCRGAPGCSSDRQCPRNAVCDARGGACVDPCSVAWCGPNADCYAESHEAVCKCRPGYSGNPKDLEKGCTSPCFGVWCGANAHCIVNSQNQGVCHCHEGFVGNPWAGGGCQPDHKCPCGPTQVCAEGFCVERCNDVRCGIGAYCNGEIGHCVCLPYFLGNPNVLCVPPFLPPICLPTCGANAHCVYSTPNRCVCNPGYSGNPYQGCGSNQRCDATQCGAYSQCIEGPQRVDCVCQAGMQGNPFVECLDVNECLEGSTCGTGASCINSVGSFHCACPPGTTGNPLFACTEVGGCQPGQACSCITDSSCPFGELCSGGFCTGGGVFPPVIPPVIPPGGGGGGTGTGGGGGGGGDPGGSEPAQQPTTSTTTTTTSTELPILGNECEDHFGCPENFVCKDVGENNRQCTDVCDNALCGNNAYCVGSNHMAKCVCHENFFGDPNDLIQGCQSIRVGMCVVSADCADSAICKPGLDGLRQCHALCEDYQCGTNAVCIGKGHRPICECPQGFTGNPQHHCEPPSRDRCEIDENCEGDEACVLLPTGIRDCTIVCDGFPCGPNAKCYGKRHKAVCECRAEFQGDPYDTIRGCQPPSRDVCTLNSDCPTQQICKMGDKQYRDCFDVCESSRCGLNAECIGKNHLPLCQCKAGFSGSATDFAIGCQPIPKDRCFNNNECSYDTACLVTSIGIKDCVPVCESSLCGPNALCQAKDHQPYCVCPEHFSGDPLNHITGCQPDLCRSDQDCPDSRICKPTREGVKDCDDACRAKRCGPNAECISTSHAAYCECRPGFEGNGEDLQRGCRPRDKCKTDTDCLPTEICRPNQKGVKDCIDGCLEALCAPNAQCSVSNHIPICNCLPGYRGDPYNAGCERRPPDLCSSDQECPTSAVCRKDPNGIKNCFDLCEIDRLECGSRASCVAENHRSQCVCLPGFVGNPYDKGNGCQLPHECHFDTDCHNVQVCRPGTDGIRKCVDVCIFAQCHPTAECVGRQHVAHCLCPDGYTGDPYKRGCELIIPNICESDDGCGGGQACRLTDEGILDCLDLCRYIQCGPNALCVAKNHKASCQCLPNHVGDPNNIVNGCKPPKLNDCEEDRDCRTTDLCKADNQGIKHCTNSCIFSACGANAKCVAIEHRHTCECDEGYIRDPNNYLACKKRDDECKEDIQCPTFQTCKPDPFGSLKCAEVCIDFSCTPKAECVAINHKGQCSCQEGFTGDPNTREGCIPIQRNECEQNDDCSIVNECRQSDENILKCQDPCRYKQCGPNAVCIVRDHRGQCQCPPGLFIGDPNDIINGCQKVECLKDDDCPFNKACAPENYCYDPCLDGCGNNAICLVENHRIVCQCRQGYTGDAYYSGCKEIHYCELHPCHVTATCIDTPGSYICQCPQDYIGDPVNEGCRHPNSCPNGHDDCKPDAACLPDVSGIRMCKNPCEHIQCGPNAVCQVSRHQAHCVCPDNFRANPSPDDGCLRVSLHCGGPDGCIDGQVCVEGQCRLICGNDRECAVGEKCLNNRCVLPCYAHTGCPPKEACYPGGYCHVGCRDNNDCPSDEACIQNRCQNPCSFKGVCGTNALCVVRAHEAVCECPTGFEGSPTPILGCKRVIHICSSNIPCPLGINCVGERCRVPCSQCVDGEICANGVCMGICSSDSNCPPGEVCINQYCQVGCRSEGDCRLNEQCINFKCTCQPGFIATPRGCEDIDECLSNPCHPTAVCVNIVASYSCHCREGDIGDGFEGCRPQGECPNGDKDCPSNAACGKDAFGIPKCINPCDEHPCGPRADCSVVNHQPQCYCPKTGLFTGDPYEKSKGCIPVKCLHDADCPLDRQCINFDCESPCSRVDCGPYGTCVIRDRQALCRCDPGYENNGRLTCIDVDECKQHPCHSTAVCENSPGSYSCRCPSGLTGNPLVHPGCHDPNICYNGNSDCADSAACIRVNDVPYCRDPCESPQACGLNAECRAVNHNIICSCPPSYTGDPYFRCLKVECTVNEECRDNEVCERNKCIDACKEPHNCGLNTICLSKNHGAICRCADGFYGDPVAGCRRIIRCEDDQTCPSGEICQRGVCNVPCNLDRECGSGERCDEGRCVSICHSNSECPQNQVCSAGKCITVDRCTTDNECDDNQACRASSKGYNDCLDPCGFTLCAANAQCVSRGHIPVCQCKKGFYGDPIDRGCEPVECERHEDCKSNEICEKYHCVDPCKLTEVCGSNAFCRTRNHSPVCQCIEGYEGDPIVGCRPKDYCASSPCHRSAICRSKIGSYDCYCPPERNIGNPHSEPGCRGENECPRGDPDCPPTAACDRTGSGLPMCKNPCLRPDVCGVNADCRVENHRPVCFCLPGFTGNPHDALRGCVRVPVSCADDQQCPVGLICENRRCRPRCNSEADCARQELCKAGHCVLGCKHDPDCSHGEICVANNCIVGCRQDLDCSNYEACIQNTCTNPCESPTACGMNAICTVNQHHQICNCAPGFTGNPNIGCIRVLPSCVREADCPPNHYCLDGKCRVECTTDSDCGDGEKCSNNHCLALCRKDEDCQQNEICIINRCQVGCRTSDQCNDHLACVRNQCRDPCEGSATCGPNAECRVINHRPVCSCREGFIGRPNAIVGCIRPQVICIDTPCPPGLVCFNGRCRIPCTSVRDCAVNEKCVDTLCYVQCVRDRDCSSGEICIHNFCKAGCRSDQECAFNEACINNQCINPCASPTACGTNAQCDVINHEKQCTCPVGLEGDPNVECVRVSERCSSDDNCAQGRYCEASYCRVTCSSDSECFDNEKCIDRRCTIICTHDKSCFNGFICESGQCVSGCRTDAECLLKEACINQQCLNPCASPTACGTNAQCQPVDHRPLCTCLPEHTGDPRVECSPVECIIDTDCGQGKICQNYKCLVGCRLDQSCLSDEVCISRQCQKVCHFSNTCGSNALCQAENHNFRCICPPNFIGNPHVECRKEEGLCSSSSDCTVGKICVNGRCEDDVECREDSDCLLGNICQQNKCFVGCRKDDNCALDQACYNFQCQNPCHFGRNCGQNSKCDAVRHRPVCSCLPGYTGNAQIQCQPIGDVCRRDSDCDIGKVCLNRKCAVISGCSSDNDCSIGQICENTKCIYGCRSSSDCGFTEACIDRQCQNPCQPGKCGTNAECRPINHQAICRCPPDYTGKPELFCSPVREECYVDSDCELEKICFSNRCLSGCRTNAHCPLEKTCIRERCVNPCHNPDVCGTSAICRPVNHQAECICPPGTTGDAKVRCTAELKAECSRNSDCGYNFICEQGICIVMVGGCQSDSACNIGEICENEKCIVGCRRDSDCTYDKACFNSRCVNPCTVQDSCGRNADCRPVVHRPLCTCRPGYEGNPFDYCREIPPKPPVECVTDHDCPVGKICQATRCLDGCRRDEHCPYDKTCIQRQCQNPCLLPGVCGHGANCLVHNHRPVCSCPAPLTGDPNVQCRPIPEDFCYNDAGCGSGRICENSKCIDACRTHDTCPFDKACINRQCQDPCSFYGACGSAANCHAAYHEAKCTCPPDYTGNPKVHCTLVIPNTPKGCQRDDECGIGSLCDNGDCFEGCRNDYQCSLDKACIRRKCEPVCNQPGVCGTNAQCTADNHQPICTCLAGLVGDPRVECKTVPQPECISDKECPIQHICEHEKCIVGCRNDQNCDFDEACINRICQNPCSVFGACGRNAICKPLNHKPQCTCPSGYRGNPNVVCEEDSVPPECYTDRECSLGYICENNRCIVGCRHDNNCPHDLTCVNRQCQNPCLLPNVCGKNADCQPLNHRPICSCPRNFRGDPYISCELYIPGECEHDQECPVDKICESAKCIRGCRNDANCRFTETCINKLCQDPCTVYGACGHNAICKALNHDRQCTCQPGYTGNPHVLCSRIDIRYECIVDRNCSLSQICSNHRCIEGCRTNNNCPYDKTCINGRCHYVCELSGACGNNALCTPVSHQAHCSCPSGYTGDPKGTCVLVSEPACRRDNDCAVGHICSKSECISGCHTHNSCPYDQACINRVCRDPCSVGLICGINTQCHQSDHQAICSCIPGYTGDPLKQCVRIQYQCEINEDCGRNFVCVNHECKDINECLQGKGPCAPQAMCTNLPGGFKCSCPEGMDGNPYHGGCRPKVVGCTRDEHCKNHEACNKRTGYCYDVCTRPGICGPGAECTAANHHHECFCPSGYTGNPYIECSIIETCGPHNPCSGNLQCLGGTHCGCPSPFEQVGFFCILTSRNCTTTNPCQEHEQCVYSENKRGFCVCPRGFVLMTNGVCRDQNECDLSPFPCGPGAQCFNSIGSYRCQCPPGTVGEPFTSGCQRREGFCTSDTDCPQHQACDLPSQQCYNPCIVKNPCGRNADCRVTNHIPRCECPPGFKGNPEEYCYHILDCHNDYDCPGNLLCLPDGSCGCPGDFRRLSDFCILTSVNCSTTNPCPDNQQCVYTGPATGFCVCPRGYKMLGNGICVDINECTESSPPPCAQNANCINRPGSFHCICAEGREGDPYGDGCTERKDEGCKDDSYCHYQEACNIHTGQCYDVCANGQPCGENAICRGEQHKPSCSCPPRFSGNPLVHCFRVVECGVDYTCPGNLICLSSSTCGCPPNYNRVGDYCFVTSRNCTTDNPCPNNEECVYTGIQDGFCVCPRGYELMDRGLCRNIDECLDRPCAPGAHCTDLPGSYRCFCPSGTFGDPVIRGCTEIRKECTTHNDCPPDKECDVGSGECISPCYICGNLAVCTAVDHQALCSCPPGFIGDPFDRVYGCYKDHEIVDTRTSPPIIPSELSVMCLADGVQVSVELDGFNGVVYVKGHSQDPQCRRIVSNSERETIDFKVLFNTCGLIHINGEASFILVIQKHPKLVTYKAKAYHIKCVYSTGEKTITLGFNVSMITTSGTIANTGPPPTCIMTICTTDGKEVSSAEIGDDLLLKVNVQPDYIYGGFARSCVAKTMEDNEEIQYEVTNGDGCAADPSIFGNWHLDPEKKVLLARFNAFKFPTSNNLRFQCNIRVCFGSCPPVNCDGVDAFGRKKRQAPDIPLLGGEGYQEGTLREEIMVQSNAILTFDKQENQVAPPTEEPEVEKIDKVCLPKLGLIVSLVITTLLALVAVAVAISCWLMAYRRRPKAAGPLPHPPDFPNPLYTTPEPVAEPSPDYYPSSHPQYVDDKLWTSPSGPSRDGLMLR